MSSSMLILLLLVYDTVCGHSSQNPTFISANHRLYDALGYAHLTQVVEVETSHNHVVGLSMKWLDPRLVWNPAEYGDIQYLYVNANQLWIPEVTACESSKFLYISEDRARKTHAFPFDAHWCYYCFTIPRYEESELVMRGYDLPWKVVMDTNEWSMQTAGFRYDSNHTEDGQIVEDRSVIYFEVFMERRSTFWVMLIIVPSYLIGLMILLGLFFSSEEPTINTSVLNLGLISFTSMTFIIGILADSLPKSATLSNLGWYILIELLITTLAVLSVFCQTALNRWMRQGVKWYTGGVFRSYSTDSDPDKAEERQRAAPIFHQLLHYAVERIVVVGTAHFFIFFLLHTANVAWLMLYPLFDEPTRPK